jgi:hypothetical protein
LPQRHRRARGGAAAVGRVNPAAEGQKRANCKVGQTGSGHKEQLKPIYGYRNSFGHWHVTRTMKKSHNERCPECKQSVRNLLATCFGAVEVYWDLCLPCHVDDCKNTSVSNVLHKVCDALQRYRGFDHFIKSKKLPRVDFFIPNLSLIVEFDESQHFTEPRDIALGLYPPDVTFGFSIYKWRALCQTLNKHDNDPPYRDEQRAWYDTMRDFAPSLLGRGRVVRLYSRDCIWCSLNPEKKSDVDKFKLYFKQTSG